MDPVTAAIAAQVLGIGVSALGEWWASADEKKRQALLDKAQQIYSSMSPPEIAALQAQQVEHSAYEGVPTQGANRGARDRALRQIMAMGDQGGMDPGSALAVEQARRAAGQQAAQEEAAIRQQFARRGMGGAGEAMLQQQAQQNAAQRASLTDMQAASEARSRALQALATGGGMAQTAETADFEQAARRAEALDRIAEFNANIRQHTNEYNTGLQQQGFQNRLALGDRQYGALRDQAGDVESVADRKRRRVGAVGHAVSQAGGAYGSYGGGAP